MLVTLSLRCDTDDPEPLSQTDVLVRTVRGAGGFVPCLPSDTRVKVQVRGHFRLLRGWLLCWPETL